MHLALLGDSIFDNAAYVPGESPLAAQLAAALPTGAEVTLLALDGSSARDVGEQADRLPDPATHIFVSVGGNDALNARVVLEAPVRSVAEALSRLAELQSKFQRDYGEVLDLIVQYERPTVVCTIYDAIPGLGDEERTALSVFNDVILQTAIRLRLPVIDLRLVCDRAADFSTISVIEPSSRGASKIADVIAHVALSHDFRIQHTVVYSRV